MSQFFDVRRIVSHHQLLIACALGALPSHAFAQGAPTQPTCFFWEPPKVAIPLRPQFGPMARVLICNPDTTAQQVVNGGVPPMQINLQAGLGVGCGNPPNYTVSNIMQRWADPDENPSTTWKWVGLWRECGLTIKSV